MGDEQNDATDDSLDEVVEGDLDDAIEGDLAEAEAVDDAAVESGGVPVSDVPDEAGENALLEEQGEGEGEGAAEPETSDSPEPSATAVSVSRTVDLKAAVALRKLAAVVEGALEQPPTAVDPGAVPPTARFVLDDGEFVLASASARADGRATISLVRGRMPDGAKAAAVKAELEAWLDRVDA
ncbi:hypothetical protein ET445_08630 [Agromyces protaetiae]|uniref:Uncharacterized protein n=1 Tax=Agromyces protaetiae TaxID=2509455 RepID=A0A4P6FS90_9MICO|nr:hypothetical protein [Agromyces protaetiae]QAY73398.1 hypothetical protein ET445_08630 [Agromyces protaetiae]